MKRNSFCILLVVFLALVMVTDHSHAFWLWTPKTKKMENPKYAVKDSPRDQYDWAMRFYDNNDFKRAAEEFVRLTQHYPDSDIAPEAQYYAGRSYEEIGKYWFAYENYQKTVDNYPYTRRMDEIIEREYNLAGLFKEKGEPKLMDLELSISLDRAIIIYGKVVENAPFGPLADKALFAQADCYRRIRKYDGAVDAYEKIVNDYPESRLGTEARYQLAYTKYEASLDPEYDQESTEQALEDFERIKKTTPVPSIATEAGKVLDELKTKKAESTMKIAVFYERQKKYKAAIIYYQDVAGKFPDTEAAKVAREKISKLEQRIKK